MTIFNDWLSIITFLAALGSGLMAGLFFIFSVSIMAALGRLPPSEGIAAMQAINITIINPVFLLVFLGTGLLSLIVIFASLLNWQTSSSLYSVTGAGFYLIGSLVVTGVVNVPMNNEMAALNPSDPKAVPVWANYLKNWTAWNHARTVMSLLAMAFLIIGLCS
jgi:uncharacterized membrane protein